MKKTILFFSLLAISNSANAFCTEPAAPRSYYKPEKPQKPELPFCAKAYSSTKCAEWEITSYNSRVKNYNYEIERYQEERNRYIMKLKDYFEQATEYAICEAKSLED
jgi:hypothetical protein